MPAPDIALFKTYRRVDRIDTPHWIAYRDDRDVMLARVDGSEKRTVFQGGDEVAPCPLAWNPDGRTLYHAAEQLYAIDIERGGQRPLTRFPPEEHHSIFWNLSTAKVRTSAYSWARAYR